MNETDHQEARQLAEYCAKLALEKKAENVVILDLENRSSVADYFVVASGYSDRQVRATAEFVSDVLAEKGRKALHEEGLQEGKWALIDFGSVIVHIFLDSYRDFYNLEGLWGEAPRIRVTDEQSANTARYGGSPGNAHL